MHVEDEEFFWFCGRRREECLEMGVGGETQTELRQPVPAHPSTRTRRIYTSPPPLQVPKSWKHAQDGATLSPDSPSPVRCVR